MDLALTFFTGYLLGNILTGDVISRLYVKKSAFQLGTSHNPGMANIMAHIGFGPGLLTLAGDLGKTLISVLFAEYLFKTGHIGILIAGLGTTLGHDFPFWHHFKGGKGVATTCATLFLYDPLIALASFIIGLAIVLFTQYLSLGAIIIPMAYLALKARSPTEVLILGILSLIMILRNLSQLKLIPNGKAEKTDILKHFRK